EKIGKEASESDLLLIENELDKIEGDTLATIIFTSGTTGDPKGVMLTHDNYVAHCEAVKAALPVTQDGDIWLSVLPVWHSFERVFTYFVPALKSSIAYSKPIANIMLSDMKNVQPTWLCGVPRLWESLAKGIFRKMKNEKPVKRFFFNAGVKVGTVFSWANDRVNGLVCRYTRRPRIFDFMIGIVPFVLLYPLNAFFRKVVFSKLHNLFGGKMWGAVSGGGALQKDVDIFYRAIGFTLLEGYGITEAGPVLSVRDPTCPRYGCVGEVFPAATIRIVNIEEDGSAGTKVLPPGEKGIIQAKGRQIMKGYYKREDLTRLAITEDGYLNTGDIGMLTFDGEIKITGRAKDTIVLLAGENIEPATIEKALMNSPYIERAMIVGQDEKYIGALIVPEKESTMEMANNLHIIYNSWEDLLLTKEMNNFFQRELDKRVCAKTGFRLCERIGKFVLLPNQFETGKEVNAKGEMMRHKIIKLYEKEIKQLFV
ncbi:MAG: AMP-binding protein, partial [Treponema sp.]|nr:AMP-binding protein [Treponema sp.]